LNIMNCILPARVPGYVVHKNGTLRCAASFCRSMSLQNCRQTMLVFVVVLRCKKLWRPSELLEMVMQEMLRQ
jgi:hypothetical protein